LFVVEQCESPQIVNLTEPGILCFVLNDVENPKIRIQSTPCHSPRQPQDRSTHPLRVKHEQSKYVNDLSKETRRQYSLMALAIRATRTSHILLRAIPIHPLLRPGYPTIHRRTFIGQVIGVIANPFETLRQLDESRKLLEQTRQVFPLSFEC
jgi:hypothetical protein